MGVSIPSSWSGWHNSRFYSGGVHKSFPFFYRSETSRIWKMAEVEVVSISAFLSHLFQHLLVNMDTEDWQLDRLAAF